MSDSLLPLDCNMPGSSVLYYLPEFAQIHVYWVWNAVFGCNLKNDRTIFVRFQGKPFNIMVIQAYATTNNAEEAEVEQFYEDLQDLLELTPKKDVFYLIGDWNTK